MAYSKMTFADFKKKLNDGIYADGTAARRGIGKADCTDDEKAKAQRLIAKHFDESPPEPKKKKKKAGKATKKAEKQAAKAEKQAEKQAAKAEKQAAKAETAGGKKRGRKPKAETAGKAERAPKQVELFESEADKEALRMLRLSGEVIGNIHQSLAAMKLAKETNPDFDMDATAKKVGEALSAYALNTVGLLTDINQATSDTNPSGLEIDPEVMSNLERTMGAAQGLPGRESPVVKPKGHEQPYPQYQSPVSPAVHSTNGQYEYAEVEAPPAVVPGPTPIS